MNFTTLRDNSLKKDRIYLDFNATSPLATELSEQILGWLSAWGNPSSIHCDGRRPKTLMRDARNNLAKFLGVHPLEVIFTSGGSEANNTAIKGVFESFHKVSSDPKKKQRRQLIISAVEHPSVKGAAQWARERGFDVTVVPVDRSGQLDIEFYKKSLSEKTALVSMMYANNETGVIFPIKELAEMAHRHGALFHSDCVQTLGKTELNLRELNVDYASFSAHKFYGLKGSGLLYVKKRSAYSNLIQGGGQERGRRGGTENVLAHTAFGYMTKFQGLIPEAISNMEKLRDYFEEELIKRIERVSITGKSSQRLPNSSNVLIEGIDGESLLMNLDIEGFSVSTGAACSSGNPEPSPVLLAMGLSAKEAQSSMRIGLGWTTSQEEIDSFLSGLENVVSRLRKIQAESLRQGEVSL